MSGSAAPARQEEPRPPLGSWRRVYALVLLDLVLVIVLCGALSRIGR